MIKTKEVIKKFRGMTLFEISEDVGIDIHQIELEEEVSGIIMKYKNKYLIVVNKDDDDRTKLFTIAHDLGHFFLHNKKVKKGIACYRKDIYWEQPREYQKQEDEADEFAFELLMPEKEVKEFYEKILPKIKTSKELIDKMSGHFQVSIDKIKQRLYQLNIL